MKHLREVHGLSQEDLCERSGLHAVQISYIENAQRDPTLGTIERVAKGFGVTIATLTQDI